MKKFLFLFIPVLSLSASCQEQTSIAQQKTQSKIKVGAPCEGCEAIYESPLPLDKLSFTDTLDDFFAPGTPLRIYGKVYQADGKTPAANVVLYIYHTDQNGRYPTRGNEKGWGRRHGYLRGWVKTNASGEYMFLTKKPEPYPGRRDPAHIHCIVKEQMFNEYFIGDFLFDDDPLIPDDEKSSTTIPGGNGLLKLQLQNNQLVGKRDIYLGRNIQNYPAAASQTIQSGLALGTNCPAFDPKHISGPDKNSTACPMCKYGKGQGVMVWWNEQSLEKLTPLLKQLEMTIRDKGYNRLRVFVMHMNPELKPTNAIEQYLHNFSKEIDLDKIALTYIPSPSDEETAGLYQINPKASNTIFIYKKRKVVNKFVNYDVSGQFAGILKKLNLPKDQKL